MYNKKKKREIALAFVTLLLSSWIDWIVWKSKSYGIDQRSILIISGREFYASFRGRMTFSCQQRVNLFDTLVLRKEGSMFYWRSEEAIHHT